MADSNNHITYSLADIQRYLQGGMSTKEMHDLERAALEDPFLADALEGYGDADMQTAHAHLAQIDTAIRQQQQQTKVVTMPPVKRYRSWQVAASVVLLICIAGSTYLIFNKKSADAPLAKAASSNSSTPADAAQTPELRASSPLADSTITAESNKAFDTKDNTTIAKSKKARQQRVQPKAEEAPEAATAMADTNADVVVSGHSTMARRAPANQLRGVVTDNNEQPIANAEVILPDSTIAVTDRHGNFQIATPDSAAEATITAFGYKPLSKQRLRRGVNTIQLKEKPFLLSDVEVTNIGTAGKRKAEDTTSAMPQGGWQSFKEYVYTKLQKKYDSTASANILIDNDLQLEFSINDAGEPFDFKVLHAPDAQTATEAINAIKEGPKWINKDKKSKMRIKVKY